MQDPKVLNLSIAVNCDSTLDQQLYNLLIIYEVATIWLDQKPNNSASKPLIKIYRCSNTNQLVNYYCGCYDPLHFQFLFHYSQYNWHCKIKRVEQTCTKRNGYQCEIEQIQSLSNMCSMIDCLI